MLDLIKNADLHFIKISVQDQYFRHVEENRIYIVLSVGKQFQ